MISERIEVGHCWIIRVGAMSDYLLGLEGLPTILPGEAKGHMVMVCKSDTSAEEADY